MKHLSFTLPLLALLICACDEPESYRVPDSTAAQEPAEAGANKQAEAQAVKEARIEELEREIENSTNIISDMEAFVLMERSKLEDNPDYDRSFMEEALADQQHQRELIETAREQLEVLKSEK